MRSACVSMMVSIICHYMLLCQRKCNYALHCGRFFSTNFPRAHRTTVILHHPAQTQHSYKLHFSVSSELSTHHSNVKLFPLCSRVKTSGRVVMLMHVNQLLAWTSPYPLTFPISEQQQTCKCFFCCPQAWQKQRKMIMVAFHTWTLRHSVWTGW